MSVQATQELAEFSTTLTLEAIPQPVVEYAKLLLLDALGCALVGHDGQEYPAVAAAARALGDTEERTVIGDRAGSSTAGAALLNGYLVSALTISDVYVGAHTHLTPPTLGACLPMAERAQVDGRTFLLAMIAGMEVGARVAVGIDYPAVRDRGWHSSGIVGPLAAAASAGVVAGLDAENQRRAFGLAGSQSGGSLAAMGTPTVKFHQAAGALAGVVSVLLAEGGFESSEDIITAPDTGLLSLFAGGGNPDGIVVGLGDDWELLNTSIRLLPGGTAHQPALGAITELLADEPGLSTQTVSDVEIYLAPPICQAYENVVEPSGTFEALRSFHFLVASLLHEGDLWLDHVGPGGYQNERIRSFAREQVTLLPDKALHGYETRVNITRQDGSLVTRLVKVAPGDPSRRATREDVVGKFRRCAQGLLTPEDAGQVVEAVLKLEDLDQLGALTRHMQPRGSRVMNESTTSTGEMKKVCDD